MINYLNEWGRDRDALLFRFGINTILRVSDIIKLRYCDIYDNNYKFKEYLNLTEQKTKSNRKIKINKVLRRELNKYCKYYSLEGEDYVFFSVRYPDKHIDRIQAWRVLKKASMKVGIENFGTHSMRKTLAYHIYKKTDDIALVMKMLNHTSPSVTLRYIGIDQDSIDKVYDDDQFAF